jgi:Flp pilus assembly protein TadD
MLPEARAGGRGAWVRAALAALVILLGPACASRAPQNPAERAARAQQLIDSGNAAYRQGDYRLAVKRYAAAAVERKDDPAAYYGMGMALGKLGRDEEARQAYQRARDLMSQGGGPPTGVPAKHP